MITDLPELTVTRLCGYLLPPSIVNSYLHNMKKALKEAQIKSIS